MTTAPAKLLLDSNVWVDLFASDRPGRADATALVTHAMSRQIALLYAAWYGAGRAWIEGLRTDSLYIGSVRVSQLLAIISCVAAIAVLARQYHRIKVAKAFYMPKTDENKGE